MHGFHAVEIAALPVFLFVHAGEGEAYGDAVAVWVELIEYAAVARYPCSLLGQYLHVDALLCGIDDAVCGEVDGLWQHRVADKREEDSACLADFLYVAVFDTPDNANRNVSGIYRVRKAMLPTGTGIETVQTDEKGVSMSSDGQSLLLPQGTTVAVVYDLAGRTVQTAESICNFLMAQNHISQIEYHVP